MKVFYFTGTGNSLYAAQQICRELNGELISIPQETDKEAPVYEDEIIGIVFPVYYFCIPNIVESFLKKAKLKADYLFALTTCGGDAGRTASELEQLQNFNYINALIMPDNYLPLSDMNKQIKKFAEKKGTVDSALKKTAEDIKNKKKFIKKTGIKGRLLAKACDIFFGLEKRKHTSQNFSLNDKCIKCGTCLKVCPVKNITLTEQGISFGSECESCLACIHACPQNALHMKYEKSDKRWMNPEISLQDIIKSNSRI